MSENIFADEWRDCLCAHYMHVIRNNDRVTEPTLRLVMQEAGFNESELAELRVRATMHVDDVGADFEPDLNVLQTEAVSFAGIDVPPGEVGNQSVEASDISPLAEAVAESDEDLLLAPLSEEEEMAEAAESESEEPAPSANDNPDAPQQLSLF